MKRAEHLLIILAEECGEVAQEASKALRFGPEEICPVKGISNAARIVDEFNDLIAMMEMLRAEGVIPTEFIVSDKIAAKKKKVEEMLEYSKKCGTLT